MSNLMILIDVHFLGHRAFYSTGHLRKHDIPTGVVFGVLREIHNLRNRFDSDNMVFCFDATRASFLRTKQAPLYKANRMELHPERKWQLKQLHEQLIQLRTEILPDFGYRNCFLETGFEADDLIAAICHNYDGDKVIISADSDLFQLLNKQVFMYNPRSKETITYKSFKKKYNISPSQWPMVKALAGCKGDNVNGVRMVGEITAIKHLRGELNPKSNAAKNIIERGEEVVAFNLPLVKLPFANCPVPRLLKQSETDIGKLLDVMEECGVDND